MKLNKLLDGVDWAFRQMQNERVLTMRQMILLFKVWTAVEKKGSRLTDSEIRKIIRGYEKKVGSVFG